MKTIRRALSSPSVMLWLIIGVALLVRLYRIGNPVADWHAFRQADTASVTREFVKHGIDLLRPHYQDLSNIQSGHDNLAGYRMVELPFVNGFLALILRAVPSLPLVLISRLASVFISLGTLWFLFQFVQKVTDNRPIAFISAGFFALLPYSIYYSRAVLPEPFLLFFSMGSLYWLVSALETKRPTHHWSFWASAVFLSLALLLKPFAAFLAPVYALLIWQKRANKKVWSLWWLVYAAIACVPLWWWRHWILQFPTGIPVSDWLLNGNGIRFRPAWFRWLFYERFTKLILGYVGILFIGVGLLWSKKEKAVLWAWWLGLLAYASVVATGNVQHDYYQVIFTPLISFTAGSGVFVAWQWVSKKWAKQSTLKCLGHSTIVLLIAATLLLSWRQVAGYFNVNHWEYVEAGAAVDQLTPLDTKVIAPAFGDTQFLFQTNRTGWPIGFEIPDKISKGAQYYVTTSNDDEEQMLEKQYTVMEKTDRFTLIDLTKPQKGRVQ